MQGPNTTSGPVVRDVTAQVKAIEWIRSTPLPDYVKNTAESIVRDVGNEIKAMYNTELAARKDGKVKNNDVAIDTVLIVESKLKVFDYNTTIGKPFIEDFRPKLVEITYEVLMEIAEKVHS